MTKSTTPAMDRIMASATDAERSELELLTVAEVKTREAYQADYSAAKKRDWDAAREGLQDSMARLETKYMNRSPAFKNLSRVLDYLDDQGYKISRSKLYKDAEDGAIRVNDDKSVDESEARAYAATLRRVSDNGGEIDETNAKRASKELDKLDLDIEKRRFELAKDQRLYMLKSDVYTEVAIKIGVMESGVKHLVMMRAADWIHAVGGDARKKQVLIDLFMADFDLLLDEMGQLDEIDVVIEKAI